MNPTVSRDNTSSWIDRHHNAESVESTPLIEMQKQPTEINAINEGAPTLAKISEIDDLDDDRDDREVWLAPRAGVDDGLLDNVPNVPNDTAGPAARRPSLGGSHDPENGAHVPARIPYPDNIDGRYAPRHPISPFPHAPGFGPDLENGIIIPELESIPDVNQYQHKKTLAQGMMDLALFSANANQLRYVLESFDRHPYYYPSLILISVSILMQVAIGLGLILNSRYNVKNEKEICIANRINNYTVIGIFLVTAVNVFVSAFGVANAPSTPRLPPVPPPIPVPRT